MSPSMTSLTRLTLLYVTALSDSTVEKFRGVMNMLYHELCVDVGRYSLAEITSIADQRYHDLVARGLWLDGVDAPTKAIGFAALALTANGTETQPLKAACLLPLWAARPHNSQVSILG